VATRAVIEACERLGLDGDLLLTDAGLERSTVFDSDGRLPAERADAVWAAAWARAGDPDLPLHAAEQLPDGAYRVLDFVVANSPSVEAALQRIVRYFPIVDPRGRFELQTSIEETHLEFFGVGVAALPAAAQLYSFAAILTRLRRSSGLPIPVERVEFTFAQPDEIGECRRVFGCEPVFLQPTPALVLKRETALTPLPLANADLLSVLDNHAQQLLAKLPNATAEVTERARAVLRNELRGGDPSAEQVAKRLGMSPRTLQRRLGEANTSFVELLSELRRELAQQYLQSSRVSVAEIAWLLGFSEQSAFSRAFKRWTGSSPASYRRQHTQGAGRHDR